MTTEITTTERFDIECASCGAELEVSIARSSRWGSTPTISISPCEHCLADAADKAREEAAGEPQ